MLPAVEIRCGKLNCGRVLGGVWASKGVLLRYQTPLPAILDPRGTTAALHLYKKYEWDEDEWGEDEDYEPRSNEPRLAGQDIWDDDDMPFPNRLIADPQTLDLPHRRVDSIVGDIEALRVHLDRERIDIVAHSASGSLALLYAGAHPGCIERIAPVTPGTRAVGMRPSEEEWTSALESRSSEAWYTEARNGFDAWAAGDGSIANRLAAAPFFYGRWDDQAKRHAASEAEETIADAGAIYYPEGAIDVSAVREALKQVAAPVLLLGGGAELSNHAEFRTRACKFPS